MRKILFPTLAAFALATAGCGGAATAQLEEQVAELSAQVTRLEGANTDLARRLDSHERRISGNSSEVATLRGLQQMRPADMTAESVPEAGGGEDGPVAATAVPTGEVAEFLKSEDGQKALAGAMREAERQRDRERTARWAGAMIDRFAADANLNTDQTERMRTLHTDMFGKMREAFSSMSGGEGATPEERALAREEAMAQIAEVRDQTTEEVKLILDADQFALYEEQASRFGGGGRGFGGRGGGRGGFGR